MNVPPATDRTIKIWDTATGEELLTLRGHGAYIHSLQWHPDGERLVSASGRRDGVRIWDAGPGYAQE